MIDTVVMRDISELLTVESAWWLLWERCLRRTPFQSPGWLLPWYRAFAPGEPLVFTFWNSGRLVGIAPFYAECKPDGLHLLQFGTAVSDFLDIVAEPGSEGLVVDALAAALSAEADWRTITFDELPPDAVALGLKNLPGCGVSEEIASTCPVLKLDDAAADDTAAVESNFPSRTRRKLRMARHRAGRRGAVHYIFTAEGSAQCAFQCLAELHTARWHARGEAGVLAGKTVRRFHSEVLNVLCPKAIARLYELRIAGETAAMYYGFVDSGCAYAYIGGFDLRFAYESPGTLLLAHAITESVRAGAREFHFLRGSEAYKYAWGAFDRPNRRRRFTRVPPSHAK